MDNGNFRAALWSRLFFCMGKLKIMELIQNPGKWVMYTGMPYWNHLGTKLHKNDANSRCDHVDFVL